MRHLTQPLLLTSVAMALAACGDATEPTRVPTKPFDFTLHRGTLVSGVSEHAWDFAWSVKGDAIYYAATDRNWDSTYLTRAPIDGGAAEVLDLGQDVRPSSGYGPLPLVPLVDTPSGDVYLLATRGAPDGIDEVLHLRPGAAPERLPGLDDAAGILLAHGGTVLIAATEQSSFPIAYTLESYDLTTGATTPLGTGVPLALSADGSELLCSGGPNGYFAVDVTSGATRDAPDAWSIYFSLYSWPPEGIVVVWYTREFGDSVTHFTTRDVATGKEHEFFQESWHIFDSKLADFSADASKLAGIFRVCTGADGHCGTWQEDLYIFDAHVGTAQTVAGVESYRIRKPAFSPDGSHIAYMIQDSVYVSPVP